MQQGSGAGRPAYGVKLVRGPFLRLDPHPRHVNNTPSLIRLCDELRAEQPGRLIAADLFSGAGGLSLGLQQAGIEVVFSVDHDAEAVETHRHHFPGMSVDWDLADADVVEATAGLIRSAGIDVLVGGPPCQPFSKAGRSGIRHTVRRGLRDPHDQRRDLWRSFIEVVRLAGPRAVVMENVPDMALDSEMFILRSMVAWTHRRRSSRRTTRHGRRGQGGTAVSCCIALWAAARQRRGPLGNRARWPTIPPRHDRAPRWEV